MVRWFPCKALETNHKKPHIRSWPPMSPWAETPALPALSERPCHGRSGYLPPFSLNQTQFQTNAINASVLWALNNGAAKKGGSFQFHIGSGGCIGFCPGVAEPSCGWKGACIVQQANM